MGNPVVKSSIPDPLASVLREIVYPAEIDKKEASCEAGGFEFEVRREITSGERDDQIVVTVPSEEAEMELREWFGHVDPDSNVNGFQATSISDEEVVLRISRPVLITESLP